MHALTLDRPTSWGVIILLGLVVLLPAKDLPAQDTSCAAVDQYDIPRGCTFLEEHGGCLWNALDSFGSCEEGAGGFFDLVSCHLGVQVDLFACNMGLPLRLLKSIFAT